MPNRIRKNIGPCSVSGCGKPSKTRELCSMHLTRYYRHGDVMTVRLAAPQKRSNGYLTIADRSHPLTDSHGNVYIHRKVLFEHLGSGPTACTWCGVTLHWKPEPGQRKVYVDHLDWNRENNVAENLVPSCDRCNSGRPHVIRKGEALHSARLTNEDIYEIRASSLTYPALADIYGVKVGQIGRIKRGEQWKHLLAG